MPQVLVTGATIQCTHGGVISLTQGDDRLQVKGKATIVAGQEAGLSFAPGAPGVTTPCPFSTGGSASPCTSTLAASAGISTLLQVGNRGVLLSNATGQTVNTPPATWSVQDAGQTLLSIAH